MWNVPTVAIRVSPDGNDANDGSNGLLPRRRCSPLPMRLWVEAVRSGVKAGIYYERITLDPHAKLYGGFAGTENTRGARNWTANTTILDGSQGGSVVTAVVISHLRLDQERYRWLHHSQWQFNQRRWHIMRVRGIPYYFQQYDHGEQRPWQLWSWRRIYCNASSSTISNNTITGNSAQTGGGMFCYSSALSISGNTITKNTASLGGGVCFAGSIFHWDEQHHFGKQRQWDILQLLLFGP